MKLKKTQTPPESTRQAHEPELTCQTGSPSHETGITRKNHDLSHDTRITS